MKTERTSFRDHSPWPGWANALFWGALVASCYPLLAGWHTDMLLPRRLMMVGSILVVAVGLKAVLGGLSVLVQETRLYLYMGWVPLIRKIIPFDDIVEIQAVRYHPIREFGGWGLRGFGKKRAWTSRGDQAVVLTFADGARLYVGSDHPQRLEDRIRVAGGRWRGSGVRPA